MNNQNLQVTHTEQWTFIFQDNDMAVNTFRFILRNWLINSRTQVSQRSRERERERHILENL